MTICGGFGGMEPATQETQALLESVQDQIKAKIGSFEKMEALEFSKQVVAGMNYQIRTKVTRGGAEKIHSIKIYQPLPHTQKGPELTEWEEERA